MPVAKPGAVDVEGVSPGHGPGVAVRQHDLDRRLKRGKELAARLPERRGESSIARRPKDRWCGLHAASVGEMLSILPLIERIRERDITVLVTAGTVTAARLGRAGCRRRDPSIRAARPAAIRGALPRSLAAQSRLVRGIRPMAQSDHGAGADRGIPLILVNGRVSERSFQRWRSCRARSHPCSAVSISVWRNPPRMPRGMPDSARRATS